VHKANLGSQLSIFDTGSFARACPRPNPPERVHTGALKRPARTTQLGALKRPARTSSHGRPQTTRPNEFTRAPSNDPTRQRTTRHGSPQTSCPNEFHNSNDPPNEFTRAPSNDPPERPKRTDKGEPGKRAARTCTKPTSGHNLAFLIRPSPERPARNEFDTGALKRAARTTHPQTTTRPNEFTRAPSNDPPERPTRTTRPNEFTRAPSNDPPERPKRTDKGEPGKRAARTCTKPTSGHNLAFLIRARPNDPPERVRAPRNDPPERVHTGALKRPARTSSHGRLKRPARTSSHVHKANLERPTIFDTSSHGRPQTTRPNEFTWAPSTTRPNDMGARNRTQGRAGQTSCTNVHKANLGSQLSIFDTALARTTLPEREFTPPSNDPPERPARTSSHGRPQTTRPNEFTRTTRPNEFTRAPSNDPPEPHPNDPPERVHTGALKRPARTSFHGRPNDRNEPTRESRANELHERAQSQPRVTT
jgi:hypothetical protein